MTERHGRRQAAPLRWAVAMLVVATCVFVALGSGHTVAAAQQQSPVSAPSIIPRPNSGAEPKSATDRGGWAQYAVLAGMVVALGAIVVLVRRESRSKRDGRPTTGNGHPTPST